MQMVHMAMGHNHIQVGALSSDTRMATLPMPNTGPRCTAHQSAMPLSPLHDTTLYTTRPGNHYPNYTVADHEGSTGTPRTSDAPFLPCMTQLSIQPGHATTTPTILWQITKVPQERQEHQMHPISRLVHEKLIP